MVEDIHSLFASFEFVRRKGNLAAHLLPKHAISKSSIKDVVCVPRKLFLSLCNVVSFVCSLCLILSKEKKWFVSLFTS